MGRVTDKKDKIRYSPMNTSATGLAFPDLG
jgi:hypothetical protein